jgi:hypothetical protein
MKTAERSTKLVTDFEAKNLTPLAVMTREPSVAEIHQNLRQNLSGKI